jgi:predicted phage-related endonuclease
MANTKRKNQREIPADKIQVTFGGTDAIKIVKGEWKDIWLLKTNRAEREDLSNVLPVQMGLHTEPFNIDWFQKRTGLEVTNNNKVYKNEDVEFLHATVDGIIDEKQAIFEAKHVSPFSAKDVIDRYYPQLQHYMLVTGLRKAYLSVLIGNLQHKVYEIDADIEFIHKLLYAETHLWAYVQADVQPPDYVDFEAFTQQKEKINGLSEEVIISIPSWLQGSVN